MPSKLNPYLTFIRNAREAMEFYQSVFGGELTLQTFKSMHASQGPELDDLIMHGQLITATGMTLMGSDDPESANASTNTSIAVSGEDEGALRAYWEKLNDSATVLAPFGTAPWGDVFGMLVDKFGIRWMINVNKPKAA
ncbi:MAG: VOC family protein [Polyangiales bacterium]|nr:VOC family protein [Myxococcales bacterium]